MKTAKDAYLEQAKARFKAHEAEIERLKREIKAAGAEDELDQVAFIAALNTLRVSAQRRLHELDEANDETWEVLKEDVEKALNKLEDAFKEAVSRYY